jgi:hypothetical protein
MRQPQPSEASRQAVWPVTGQQFAMFRPEPAAVPVHYGRGQTHPPPPALHTKLFAGWGKTCCFSDVGNVPSGARVPYPLSGNVWEFRTRCWPPMARTGMASDNNPTRWQGGLPRGSLGVRKITHRFKCSWHISLDSRLPNQNLARAAANVRGGS